MKRNTALTCWRQTHKIRNAIARAQLLNAHIGQSASPLLGLTDILKKCIRVRSLFFRARCCLATISPVSRLKTLVYSIPFLNFERKTDCMQSNMWQSETTKRNQPKRNETCLPVSFYCGLLAVSFYSGLLVARRRISGCRLSPPENNDVLLITAFFFRPKTLFFSVDWNSVSVPFCTKLHALKMNRKWRPY